MLGFLRVGHCDRVFFNKRSGYPFAVNTWWSRLSSDRRLSHIADFLCPALQALDNTSLYSGMVVGSKVKAVICARLFSEHRRADGGGVRSLY